jgi:hypothetical protein
MQKRLRNIIVGVVILLTFQSNYFAQSEVTLADSSFENYWQAKIGYSLNNVYVTNIEGSYIIPISHLFEFSLDARIYSFITISPSIRTRSISVLEKLSIYPKFGLGFATFGPFSFLGDIGFELGVGFVYKLSDNYNLLIEYKQFGKNSLYEGFESLPPKQIIDNFPIRFISIGLEF